MNTLKPIIIGGLLDYAKALTIQEKQFLLFTSFILKKETIKTGGATVLIKSMEFADFFNFKKHESIEKIELATKSLFKRAFTKKSLNNGLLTSSWIYKVSRIADDFEVSIHEDVVSILLSFDCAVIKDTNLNIILPLKLNHALDMYLYFKSNATLKRTSISKNELITALDLPKSYQKNMSNFKLRFLNPVVDEINKKTDLSIEYSNITEGALITGFEFKITQK